MKAILLAGGKGTRLRPLTIHTPKPIVPILERPFLHYQLDLLKKVPEIDEVILSLNYQPRRIEEIFGDGTDANIASVYAVEPAPPRRAPPKMSCLSVRIPTSLSATCSSRPRTARVVRCATPAIHCASRSSS